MEWNLAVLEKARRARDPRFDGKFYIGVTSTGIFCRPICPAKSPKETNVIYYRTASAALEAGFRPCLRCRPECSPGTPAWGGTSAVVSRALREIASGVPSGSLEELAAKLGIGTRHLRRLFEEHLGASPVAVAQTQRLLSAKRLIDATSLPLTTIASAAGYGSIRRFNEAFQSTYKRSPSEFRRSTKVAPDDCYEIPLRYRPPFDWEALLAFFAARAIPGVESVSGDGYARTTANGWFSLKRGKGDDLVLRIAGESPGSLLKAVARVRRVFDLDADPLTVHTQLCGDRLLSPLIGSRPGLRVPGAWDGFEIGVRAILGQQVSVAGASTLAARVIERWGRGVATPVSGLTHAFPAPEVVAEVDIAAIGMPAKRAEAIKIFARAVAEGSIQFESVYDVEAFREKLIALPGIGPWTADYISMRALGEPDAFPAGDLVLIRAAGARNEKELEAKSEAWRPWRAYAALHLWQGVRDGLLQNDGKSSRRAAAGG